MSIARIVATSIVAFLVLAQGAGAQEWWQKKQQQQQQQQKKKQPPQSQQQPGWQRPQRPPAYQPPVYQPPVYQPAQPQRPVGPPALGGACVPSGFARLTRNCSVDTGACQRLPENCSRGWCCP